MNLKTKPVKSPSQRFTIEPYKYLGKTDNYAVYLRTRRELGRKFMLHQPLVQKIFRECIISLPDKLFNLGVLRNKPNETKELENSFNHFITEAENILHKFYYRLVEIVEADDSKADSVVYERIMKVSRFLVLPELGKSSVSIVSRPPTLQIQK